VAVICPAKSEENSLNPNLLGTLLGPTKSSIVFVGKATKITIALKYQNFNNKPYYIITVFPNK